MTKTWMLIYSVLSLCAFLPGRTLADESPFACNRAALNESARKRHFDELGPALRAMIKNVRELPDGYEFQFPSNPGNFRLVAEWVAGEHLCCPLFDIDLRQERENGGFSMRLSGRPGVKQFIQTDFGKWMNNR